MRARRPSSTPPTTRWSRAWRNSRKSSRILRPEASSDRLLGVAARALPLPASGERDSGRDLCATATGAVMTLADQGLLELGQMRLEYRMIGPRPDAAPTLILLHEGLGCVAGWGSFAQELAAATGTGVFVYSRAGYGRSPPGAFPPPGPFLHRGALDVLAPPPPPHGFPPRAPLRPPPRAPHSPPLS